MLWLGAPVRTLSIWTLLVIRQILQTWGISLSSLVTQGRKRLPSLPTCPLGWRQTNADKCQRRPGMPMQKQQFELTSHFPQRSIRPTRFLQHTQEVSASSIFNVLPFSLVPKKVSLGCENHLTVKVSMPLHFRTPVNDPLYFHFECSKCLLNCKTWIFVEIYTLHPLNNVDNWLQRTSRWLGDSETAHSPASQHTVCCKNSLVFPAHLASEWFLRETNRKPREGRNHVLLNRDLIKRKQRLAQRPVTVLGKPFIYPERWMRNTATGLETGLFQCIEMKESISGIGGFLMGLARECCLILAWVEGGDGTLIDQLVYLGKCSSFQASGQAMWASWEEQDIWDAASQP